MRSREVFARFQILLAVLTVFPASPCDSFENVRLGEVLQATTAPEVHTLTEDRPLVMYVYVHPRMCKALLKEKETWLRIDDDFGKRLLRVIVIIDGRLGEKEAAEFAERNLRGLSWRIDGKGKVGAMLSAAAAMTPVKVVTARLGGLRYYDTACTDAEERENLYEQVRKIVLQAKDAGAREGAGD